MRKLFIVAAIIGAVAFTSTFADASALRSVGFGASGFLGSHLVKLFFTKH